MKIRATNSDIGMPILLLQRRKIAYMVLLCILFAAIMVCCGKSDDISNEHRHKSENVIRYDVFVPFGSLDPTWGEIGGSTYVCSLLYSYLFVPDENGKIQPDLANKWHYNPKSFTWTIYLKKKVRFHNGKPVTPKDVVYSLKSVLSSFRSDLAFLVYDISTFPDDAVRIRLKKDDPGFLSKIWDTAIIPGSDGKDMDLYNHPIGSGPFRFKYREGNRKVVLEANKDYYEGRPFVDRIVFIYQADREKSWIRLLAGETDIAQEITPKNYKMLKHYQDRFYFDEYTLRFYTILLYNTYDPLFSDSKVRRALSLAIDRWYIVENILNGYGRVANGPMGVDSPFHNPNVKPVPYDPQKSLALLKEVGWSHDRKSRRLFKDGKPFEFTILVFKESQIEKKVARYIQLCLNDLGIRVKLQALPFENLHRRYCRSTDFHAVLTELNGAYRNPEIIQMTWSPRTKGKSYAGGFKHTQVTRLLKKGLSEKNPEKQKDVFCKIDTLITSLQPGTFLFHKTANDAMSKRFQLPHTFSLNHEGIYRLRHAVLKQD